jgi:hypothetical protein
MQALYDMNKSKFLLLSIFLSGCMTLDTHIYELYSQEPIDSECAYLTINSMSEFDFVKRNEYEIIFYSKVISGNLFHGGEIAFTDYGLTIEASVLSGIDPAAVMEKITNKLSEECTKAGV